MSPEFVEAIAPFSNHKRREIAIQLQDFDAEWDGALDLVSTNFRAAVQEDLEDGDDLAGRYVLVLDFKAPGHAMVTEVSSQTVFVFEGLDYDEAVSKLMAIATGETP